MANLIKRGSEPMSVETTVLSGPLLDDLHNGEREAFVRFYELFRLPVYNLAWRLMRGRGNVAAVTSEVFLTAYRQILLHDGTIDPRPWIYRVAVDVCSGHTDEARTAEWPPEPARSALGRASARRSHDELASSFEQALMALSGRHHLALLLKDIHGLRLDEIAAVLGVSEETAKTTLFRAREDFRRAFEEQSQGRRDQSCRLAEQAAAGSVGRGMAADELRKLREHAEYCRRCRRTMRSWGEGVCGLALFLREAALPDGLQAVPVFGAAFAGAGLSSAAGTARAAGAAGTAGGASVFSRVFAQTGRALASRSTAYAVTLVCLIASAGVIAYVAQHDWTRIVRVQEIVRVRQLVPGPVRTVQAQPTRTTQVTPRQTGGSTGSAGIAMTTPRASRPVTRPAVYVVPKKTTSGDIPVVAGSAGGSAPAAPAKDEQPPVPASSATTTDGGGGQGIALLGHADRGHGKHTDQPASSAGEAQTGQSTSANGHTGDHISRASKAQHPGQQQGGTHRTQGSGNGQSARGSGHGTGPQGSGHSDSAKGSGHANPAQGSGHGGSAQGSRHSSGRHAGGQGDSSRGGTHAYGGGGGHGGGMHADGAGGGHAGHGNHRG
jgi:RNA polymerase sigma factor (sigma-70 family)